MCGRNSAILPRSRALQVMLSAEATGTGQVKRQGIYLCTMSFQNVIMGRWPN